MDAPLPAGFYDRPAAEVARDLLGAVLECTSGGALTRGRIVEVEAYLGPHDPACHAAAGRTMRNARLHGPPGTAYVYRIYGLHWCVNAVTREEGFGSAVLIRAIAPLDGIPLMQVRRGGVPEREVGNGPGKLCQALGIDGSLDGARLDQGSLRLLAGERVAASDVAVTPRVGISKAADWPLRFVVRHDPFVSRVPSQMPTFGIRDAAAWCRARGLR